MTELDRVIRAALEGERGKWTRDVVQSDPNTVIRWEFETDVAGKTLEPQAPLDLGRIRVSRFWLGVCWQTVAWFSPNLLDVENYAEIATQLESHLGLHIVVSC